MIKNFSFKFVITLFLFMLLINILMPFVSFAENYEMAKEYLDSSKFDDSSYTGANASNTNSGKTIQNAFNFTSSVIGSTVGVVLNLVRIIALGWAVIMAISIAIKYMSGSNQIKAQIKTDMPTYITGAVLLFGAAGLITFVKYLVEIIE